MVDRTDAYDAAHDALGWVTYEDLARACDAFLAALGLDAELVACRVERDRLRTALEWTLQRFEDVLARRRVLDATECIRTARVVLGLPEDPKP